MARPARAAHRVALHRPGPERRGQLDAPIDGYGMSRYADDLAAVLDALGVAQAVCCGLSMGGYVLFEFLRRHAARVRGLILCDTKAEPDTAEGEAVRDELVMVAERILGVRHVGVPAAGHLAPLERPDAVNRALIEFLLHPSLG